MEKYDVIIIGGGLAGTTASRELKICGINSIILEAKDRLGGRTYTSNFNNTQVELGGTWVHWNQPHMWTEITRYNMSLIENGVYRMDDNREHIIFSGLDINAPLGYNNERIGWITESKLKVEHPERIFKELNVAIDLFFGDTYKTINRPHDLFKNDFSHLEAMTARERLDEIDLDPEIKSFTDAILTTIANRPLDQCSVFSLARWYALSSHAAYLLWDVEERYYLREGMQTLVEKIAADGGEIRLSTPVKLIQQLDDHVIVTTESGEQLQAKKVMVTIPRNALNTVEFSPPLSEIKQKAIIEGKSSVGFKLWVRIRGLHAYVGAAPDTYPLNFLVADYHVDGDTLLYAFGHDTEAFDIENRAEVEIEIRKVFPEAEVLEVYVHNWVPDKYAQGTWAMSDINYIQKYIKELQKPEGNVHLAGSDVANGWYGFMDGAIESGISVSRQIIKDLI